MRRVYSGLPSVRVEPLHFSTEDISGERLLAMMKVDENTRQSTSHFVHALADLMFHARNATLYGSNHVNPSLDGEQVRLHPVSATAEGPEV